MKFLKNLFINEKNYRIHEIGGGDDDAYITFEIDKVVYMLLLGWEDDANVMDITFGVEDEYDFDTTNLNKPYTVVNTVYDIVADIIKFLEKKHKYNFTGISFASSNVKGGESGGKELRDRFFMRRILRDFPKATISEEDDKYLFINLYGT